ncbi:subtilisin [Catalinimonas alkaloidigena]|uniref:S8 family peptidase n=1 Tax=Catalinimonas alkaloidigena TaxID=1075417 RepID=UPI002404F934|nr:S8 family peptidase [Catalinimonas alkaloidigena]MDF9796135.1 subtilisin [Catalinimonas alkaloidigena]
MAKSQKKRVIITFKPKEKRADKKEDKVDIVKNTISSSDTHFFNANDWSRGQAVPSGMPTEQIGYDVNQYEAPIVMGSFTDDEIKKLEKNNNIAKVEEDGEMHAFHQHGQFSHLQYEGQPIVQSETIPEGINQIKAPNAWQATQGMGIKVAILDTGIDYNHPDLKDNYRFGISFIDDESSPMDYNGHGTHCAGTVAAAINGEGVVGVAPSAYLYAVKVLSRTGSGAWSNLIAGIDWCINKKNMDIISMSLGASSAPSAVETICLAAWKKGAILVAAAGNSGGPVGAPALFPSVIAVSAIDNTNTLASFSCRGSEVELCAPGVNVLSTKAGGGYVKYSGTSMACPHVAGAAAIAKGTHRYASNVEIRSLLARTADELGNPGHDDDFGYGRVDPHQAAFSNTAPSPIPGLP